MQNKNSFLFFSLTGILALLFLSAAILPADAAGPAGSEVNESRPGSVLSSQEQASSCLGLLMDAAAQAGVQGNPDNILDNISENGEQFCSVGFYPERTMPVTDTLISLNIFSGDSAAECKPYPLEGDQSITFHGYNALSFNRLEEYPDEEVPENSWTHETIITQWGMYKGGRCHILKTQIEISTPGLPGPSQDHPIADVLWSLSENRLPLTEETFDSPEQPSLTADPGGNVSEQPEIPTDQNNVPTEKDGPFDIPLAVILGSLGIPVAGALAGVVLSVILSGTSAVASSAAGSWSTLRWSSRWWRARSAPMEVGR